MPSQEVGHARILGLGIQAELLKATRRPTGKVFELNAAFPEECVAIILEADVTDNPEAVYDLLEKTLKSTPLHLFNVTQVELAASMVVEADKPPRLIPIRITHPNACSLKYDKRDLKLRDMLESSGIEPKEPKPEEDNGR